MKKKKPIHIVEVIADPLGVTYFNLFAELSKKHSDIKLTFIYLHDKQTDMEVDMKQRGCDCYWVKFDNEKRVKSWFYAYKQLKNLFKQLKPDVVHSHLFDDGLPTMLAAKHSGVKKRIHTKQSTTFNWIHAPKAVFLDRLINRWATDLIAVSSEAQKFVIEKEKADKRKVHLIHHGISFDNLKKANEKEILAFKKEFNLEGKKVVGTVSRYIKWKGYNYFIEAANILKQDYPDLIFMGVGSGPQEQELRELIKQKGLDNQFILTGWIEKKYIAAVFQSFDVYAHAAHMEPFGFVIPEAMINKIPIVTTPTGSALDGLVHLESAYIAPYFNAKELAKGIAYMLENNTLEITNKAYQSAVDNFSIETMWKNYLNLYLSS